MSKKTGSKMKTRNKIFIAIASVLVVAIAGVSIYWFSIPEAGRNMMLGMMMNNAEYDNYEEYQVVDYRDHALEPTSFDPVAAESPEGDNNYNVMVVTEMLQNGDSTMLKQGNTQTVGVDNYNGWEFLADEGASTGEYPYGPSPLSYYTGGEAANLHTQVLKAAEVLEVELDYVCVEVTNDFRWDDMLADDGTGHLDISSVNIIIESDLSEKTISEIKEMALASWAVGEALANATSIEPELVVNGDNWDEFRAIPGTTNSDVSMVGNLQMSQISDPVAYPTYTELAAVAEEESILNMVNSMSNMEFQIYAIAESANDPERPYLTKLTISAPTYETWDLYADEIMFEGDIPVAPTSLEYFTMGTALCLTSQTTIVSSTMDLDFTEYRVENQTAYRMEDVEEVGMTSYTDTVHSYVLIESDESAERLEQFFNKSLSLCFAGEGLLNETEMDITTYLNGEVFD